MSKRNATLLEKVGVELYERVMKSWRFYVPLLLLVTLTAPRATSQRTAFVEKLAPEIDSLFASDVKVERVATGFKWVEGPIWIHGGYLLFAEIPSNSIRKWTPNAGVTIFMQPSGYTGLVPYGGPEPGSNGMTLDARGRLTVAGHAKRNVWRLETINSRAQVTVLADNYEGKQLNSPNDLVYGTDGSLYFTDPPYGLRTQSDKDPEKQLTFNGVYRIPGASKQAPGTPPAHKLQLLIKDLPHPNGITFSPDHHFLYVGNSEPRKFWMRYEVKEDGSLAAGKVFFDSGFDKTFGGPDGMKVDEKGDLYSAGQGGVWIFSSEGKHLGTIRLPERAVGNVGWGDADGKALYITASTSVYRVRVNIPGVRP
jgi:gluconolactonase